MKFILKGKEFLSKKLEELDIAADTLDIVSEQIPGRLKQPLRVLQNNQIDLESNQAYETYFKSYPNHHISHYLLQKYNMSVQTNLPTPPLQLPNQNPDLFIPHTNAEMQRKALLLKEVVDEYDEGYHKMDEGIICLAVIHFHHKRGTEIQYKYPQNKVVEDIQNLIVHHAMPDSSHNKMEDYNFFNFEANVKGKRKMLFGVSYFKQIKVTTQMKQKNAQLSRSYMQKALAVVSTLPLFGYLKLRLASTTKVFFSDYNNYQLINAAYKDLNKNVCESWPKLEMNQLYIGSDLKVIINLFGVQEFYQIWKAVLYQKRVVIFAHSSSSASSFIISLLTLFPGLSSFGLFSKPISKYMQSLRQYALPLRTFSSDNFMAMSFHIQDFHLLSRFQKSNKGSFLLGTTNRLLKEANDYGIEMLVNLQNCTIEKRKARVPWQPLSKIQKSFIAKIEEIDKMQKNLGYEGSEDMIRNKFHNFLKMQLGSIMTASQKLREWMSNCREYERGSKDRKVREKGKERERSSNNYKVMLDEGQGEQEVAQSKKVEEFPPIIPNQVSNIPFPGLLLTKSFPYFLQFHNQKIPDILSCALIPSLTIQNYEYILRLPDDNFISYNWHQNKLLFGHGQPSDFEGKEIKFHNEQSEVLRIKNLYIGHLQNYKYNRNGFYLDSNEVFEGQYDFGAKDGYGKLTNTLHKYIGNFKNNLYDGDGQLVVGQDIYVGQFREGMKHGSGRNQGSLDYDGEWVNNRPQGNGILKVAGQQFMGRFQKGKAIQELQYTLRFQNGALYKGKLKDMKPHGRGYLIDGKGTRLAQYKDGELVCQILQEEEDKKQAPKEVPKEQQEKKEKLAQKVEQKQKQAKEQQKKEQAEIAAIWQKQQQNNNAIQLVEQQSASPKIQEKDNSKKDHQQK